MKSNSLIKLSTLGTGLIIISLVVSGCSFFQLSQLASDTPPITVNPSSGPTGTHVKITLSGALPNAPVTLFIDQTSVIDTTDASGNMTYDATMTGQVGDVIPIKATIGNANEQEASTEFTITAPSISALADGGSADEGSDENTFQTQAREITVTLDKYDGPTGTVVTITVDGANPGEQIVIKHTAGSTFYKADDQGNFVLTDTMVGQIGDVITITAEVGLGIDPASGSADFTITGGFASTYSATFEKDNDPGGHGPYTDVPTNGEGLELKVREGSLIIEGPYPWVNVSGDLSDDGSFMTSGSGTVAGYSNIAVTFDGTISPQNLNGIWTLGANGGLPGGSAISYLVIGEPIETEVETSAVPNPERVTQFFDSFNAVQSHGDSEAMFGLLHIAVLDLYGVDACRTYLESVVNPSAEVEVLDVTAFGPWDWVRDEHTIPINDAYTAKVIVHSNQGDAEQVLHIAVREDGTLGWFTDCGDTKG